MRKIFDRIAHNMRLLAFASGLCLFASAPVNASGAWTPNEDDSILLDVHVKKYRLGEGVRGYQNGKDICVDLGDMIIALDVPVRLDKKSRRATGWLFAEEQIFAIDRDSNMVQTMNKRFPLGAGDLYDTVEGWCVNAKSLASWLGVELIPNLNSSTITLVSQKQLPFELAEERKDRAGQAKPIQQFNLDGLPQAKDAYRFWRTPSVDVVASLGARKKSRGALGVSQAYEIFASGELAMLSYDARIASGSNGLPESLRLRGYRNDPKGGLLGPLKATQFAFGDVSLPETTSGTTNSTGRGAFVSNRPLGQPDVFDRTNFRGELPDGWDAELYRNGQLIGFTQGTGDGRYEFLDVQLYYGQNRFETVLYGPQGQVRRDSAQVPVGVGSIPPRETYYWAGVQQTGHQLIELGSNRLGTNDGWRGGFGIERGIDARTSVSAAFTTSMFRTSRQNHLEAAIRRAIGPALVQLATSTNLVGGYALHGKTIAQAGGVSIAAEAAMLRGGFSTERFEVGLRDFLTLSLDQNIKLGGREIPLRIDVRRRAYTGGRVDYDLQGSTSQSFGRLHTGLSFEYGNSRGEAGQPVSQRLTSRVRLSGSIGKVRLRGEAGFGLIGDKGFQESRLSAEMRTSNKSEIQASLGYSAKSRQISGGMGYSRQFSKFALRASATGSSDGSIAAGLNLAFSFGPKPTGGFRVTGTKLASKGQAIALVFQDLNSDGIRQDDEPVEKAVEIAAGLHGRSEPTGTDGMTLIEGLEPYKPILLSIDDSTLPDPYMQPAQRGIVVTPRPGVATIVEMALVSSGEIAGVLQQDGGRILSGVDLELIDARGNMFKTTRSEIDGYFLFEKVPYGIYSVRIAQLAANIVGVEANLSVKATVGSQSPEVELGVILAKAAQRIANAQTGPPQPQN